MRALESAAPGILSLSTPRGRRVFALLVLTNGFVGTMIGVERTLVPLLGDQVFQVGSRAAVLSFIATFGIAKAFSNLAAGAWSDRVGRRRVLLAGWMVGLPVPLLLMFAPPPHWWLVIFANVLLGVNQGLCWSMTVVMKVDIAGARRRGFAIGMNEFAGYSAVAVAALATGVLAGAYGLRPWPFLIGLAAAVAGLLVTVVGTEETKALTTGGIRTDGLRRDFLRMSWSDSRLRALNQAGLVKNLNDGVAWGLFPILFLAALRDPGGVGVLVAAYPLTWGLAQLATGPLSDSIGRRALIVGGMLLQGAALVAVSQVGGFGPWLAAMIALGLGTAMVYPTLMSAVGDVARAEERGTAMGVYRFWRDMGFAVGALGGGVLADALGVPASIAAVGTITIISGLYVAGALRPAAPAGPPASS